MPEVIAANYLGMQAKISCVTNWPPASRSVPGSRRGGGDRPAGHGSVRPPPAGVLGSWGLPVSSGGCSRKPPCGGDWEAGGSEVLAIGSLDQGRVERSR
jgi:hypothetical protein